MDAATFLERNSDISAKVDELQPQLAFLGGYESAILMVLHHEKNTGHKWVQAMTYDLGHCDDCPRDDDQESE